MALTAGTRLGAYEVIAQIGGGGMGEVYRATDSNLKRSVAIKVLPASVAGDADRLARFHREAEVLAALNHPNIAAIYGLEKAADVTALVMELVEGEDLSRRIARGAIPIDQALSIAQQIADALEAAHEQGIIHRDLKPANIKVRTDGTVKVLDFGLAKAMDPPGSFRADAMNSPTLSVQATMQGVILGTAAYMAPEQARGKTVDKRSDIWAFGVVLFEMLTGMPPFPGVDISQVLARVIERDPDWTTLPPTLPPSLATCLRRCLVKDPRQRIRDIGDVRLVLDGAFDTAAPLPAVSPPLVAPRRPLPWIAAFAVAAITAVALSIPAARHLRETPPPETRPEIVTPATVDPASFALAPDGRQIVFVASDEKASRLWLRPLWTTTAQPLAGTDGARNPFWSPDSKSVGFFAEGALKRLDLGGGAPQTLAPAPIGYGGTWSADGVIVFAPSFFNPLMRVSATGGGVTAVTTIGRQEWGHFHPQFLPDGRRFLFSIAGSDAPGVYLGRLDGSTTMRLTPDSSSGVYAPEGFLLWVRTGALMAQRLDVEQPALTGEPVTIADGVAVDSNSYRSAVSVAETGLVAYRMSGALRHQLTWFDRSGAPRGIVGEPDDILNLPRVSPDGRRVAVVRTVQGNQDLWLLDDARASRFTFDPGAEFFPVWSPDGTRIMYTSLTVMGSLLNRLTSGAGVEERFLIDSDQIVAPSSWSEDGRFFMYNRIDPKTGADLWAVPMRGNVVDGKPFEVLKTPFREAYGAFSPDGRWVAYHSNESGRPEVYVRPFVPPGATDTPAAATGRVPVSTGGGIMAMWRSDGKELYYLNPDGAMMAVPIDVTGTAVEPGAPVMLFPTRIYGGGVDIQAGRQYDVTRDGRFLINTLLNEATASITLLQNWNPEAKK